MSSRLDVNRVFSGGATEHTLQEVVAGINYTTATLQNNDIACYNASFIQSSIQVQFFYFLNFN